MGSPAAGAGENGQAAEAPSPESVTTEFISLAQTVQIDAKPDSDTDVVNLLSNGVIPVAILTTADFDGDAGLKLIGKLFAEDDVRVYDPRPVNFQCRCSDQKVEDVLKEYSKLQDRLRGRMVQLL